MNRPPVLAQAVLRRLLEPRQKDVIAGDLLEEYRDRIVNGASIKAARRWYVSQVLSFITAATLRRMLLPGCLLWTAAAALTELVAFVIAPQSAGIDPAWAVFFISGIAVGGYAGFAIEKSSVAVRTAGFWILPFVLTSIAILMQPTYSPVPGVVAFFICVMGAALHAAGRTGRMASGIAAATLTGSLIAVVTGIGTMLMHYQHPPLAALAVIPCTAAIVGLAGSLVACSVNYQRCEPASTSLHIYC